MRWRQGRSEHGTLYQVAAKGGLSQCPSASRFDFSVRIEPRADDSLSNRRLILSTYYRSPGYTRNILRETCCRKDSLSLGFGFVKSVSASDSGNRSFLSVHISIPEHISYSRDHCRAVFGTLVGPLHGANGRQVGMPCELK